jgi:hypothetical protein
LPVKVSNQRRLSHIDEEDSYRINKVAIGMLMFKLQMLKVVVNTRAMASHLRENLTSLDTYMASINSNIELFNLHVKENRQGL